MSHHQEVIDVIRAACGQANLLTVPRSFIDFTGSLETGLLLAQVLYWSDRTAQPDGWFYKSYGAWQAEIGLSEYQVRRSARQLVARGLLVTRVKKAPGGSPTVHYRLDWTNFLVSFQQFLNEQKPNSLTNQDEDSAETLNTESTIETNNQNEESAGALPAPVVKASQEPAIEVYRVTTGRWPPRAAWPLIARAVGQGPDQLAFWQEVIRHYVACGWNPLNLQGMLDYFCRQELPTTRPARPPGDREGGLTDEQLELIRRLSRR